MSDPTCTLCAKTRPFRRGLCRTCWRKLVEHKLPLPLDRRLARAPADQLRAWVSRWPTERRQAMALALAEVAA
jgi:predicted amidophosphoribosyltransferase